MWHYEVNIHVASLSIWIFDLFVAHASFSSSSLLLSSSSSRRVKKKKNKIKNTCGCCGCYCCEWNLIPLVQSCIFSVSTFILLWLYSLYLSHQVHATARSRGFISSWFQDLAGNKPLTVLVKKVSVTKWINVPIKKRKVRKPEKLWQKAACISGAKSTEKWSFLYHLFVVVVVFVCVHVFSIKMNK